jgi:hypothetical protein
MSKKHQVSSEEVVDPKAWMKWSVIKDTQKNNNRPERVEHYYLARIIKSGKWCLFRPPFEDDPKMYSVVRDLGEITHTQACEAFYGAQKG